MTRQKATERKIGALDFAVAELLSKLTILFTHKVKGWDVASGFDYEFVGRLGADDDLNVTIRPARWPKGSAIFCRFLKGRELLGGSVAGWNPISGSISAAHYPEMPCALAFHVEPGYRFKPADVGTPGSAFLNKILEG